jgi:hypothetical protein
VDQEIKLLVEDVLGHYGWMVLMIVAGFLFKESITNALEAIMIFIGNDFNNDDVIYISGREARIVRVGISKTVFYMTDRGTKMIVPNEKLKNLTLEKILPHRIGHNLSKDATPADTLRKKTND